MEIERKFRLDRFPDMKEKTRIEQWQGYLATSPEVRIRRSRNVDTGQEKYILCIKSIGDLVRHEVETSITAEQFEELSGMLEYPLIHKELRIYPLADGCQLECAQVDNGAFCYAEVEFSSVEEAVAWQPPDFLGEEMTYESRFRMRSYWSDRTLAGKLK